MFPGKPSIEKLLKFNEDLDKKNQEYDIWSNELDEKAKKLKQVEEKIADIKKQSIPMEEEKKLMENYADIMSKLQNIQNSIEFIQYDKVSGGKSVEELENYINELQKTMEKQDTIIHKIIEHRQYIDELLEDPEFKDYFV